MPRYSTKMALALGLALATAGWPVQAQVRVSETGGSSLELVSQAYQGNELDLSVAISESGVSLVMLEGVAQAGQHVSDSIHRNSFWVDLDLKNETGVDLSGIVFSLTAPDGSQDPLDGLSFGALSTYRQPEVIEARKEFGATESNLWGFTAQIIGANGGSLEQVEFPIQASLNDPERYHRFQAAGTVIPNGEGVMVRFLVTQNGPANRAYVQFDLLPTAPIPEPRLTGITLACVSGMAAILHVRRRRARSAL